MNNLVSKNPVLRFKLGRKIVKAEEGAVARWLRRIKHPIDAYINLDKRTPNPFVWMDNQLKKIGNSLVVENYTPENRGTTNNRLRNRQLNNLNITKQNTYKIPELKGSKEAYLNRLQQQGFTAKPTVQNVSLNQTTNVVTPITKRTITPKQSSIFMGVKAGNAGAFTLTDEQKALLDLNGIKYGTALELQLGLNNYMTSNGINGSILTDNKWGDLSKRALDYVLNRLNLNGSRWFDNKAPEQMILAVPISVPTILSDFKPQILNVRNNSYNRSQTRQLMRNAGYNPYNFTGALRKALRLYLNGLSNDVSQLEGIDLNKFKFKNGGILPSRNALTRFKTRNFRKVAQ